MKAHWNEKNRNAAKFAEDKTAVLNIRVRSKVKEAFLAQAKREDKNLSEWVLESLHLCLDDDLNAFFKID